MKFLAINPGSTSTKIGVFTDDTPLFQTTLRHSAEELSGFANLASQLEFRKNLILKDLEEHKVGIGEIDAVVGRGGLLRPIPGGTYTVNSAMLDDLRGETYGAHASNLGGLIADELVKGTGKPAYIVDPVVVDELLPEAKLAGHPAFRRRSIFHALNQKAIAKQYAEETGKSYGELKLVIAHMGGGITVGAHEYGRVIDCNNGLDGDGPFTPERCGSIFARELIKACFSGGYTEKELTAIVAGKGGLVGHLGTNDFAAVMERIAEPEVELVVKGMILSIVRQIGSAFAVLGGKADAIILTGGMAYSPYLVAGIKSYVENLAPVKAYPGEDELRALTLGALRVLRGEEEAKVY